MDELAADGVLDNCADWHAFSRDPFRWFVRADDERACRAFAAVDRSVIGRLDSALSDWLR